MSDGAHGIHPAERLCCTKHRRHLLHPTNGDPPYCPDCTVEFSRDFSLRAEDTQGTPRPARDRSADEEDGARQRREM